MWTSVGRLDLPAGGRLVPAHTRRQTRKRVIVVPSVATPAWRGRVASPHQVLLRSACSQRKEGRSAALDISVRSLVEREPSRPHPRSRRRGRSPWSRRGGGPPGG